MASGAPRILTHLPAGLLEPLRARFPEAEIIEIPEQGELDPGLRGNVLLTQAWGSPNLADVMQRGIAWVHAYGTGVDAFPFDVLGPVPLTCSRGASAVPIAEWVMAMLLAAEKQLPDAWVREAPERWNTTRFLGGLAGRTLGVVGLGGIGGEVVRRARAFDMRIVALRRNLASGCPEGVRAATNLRELLAASDHLVLAAPATRETHHLIGREALAAARPHLHLVNVSRGTLVDQEALRDALDEGRVALASLDVATPEPLPVGHWMYTHPRIRLSPHISWSGPGALEALLDPFVANLGRFLASEPLQGGVDVEQGY